MNKYYAYVGLLFLVSISCSSCKTNNSSSLNEQLFLNPPQSAKVHTWWHWMNGNITREGITKDLESMSKQGISQATILNIGLIKYQDSSITRVVFNSPEWHEMFRWALDEASRLNIKIGAHNCDGWNSSGGPWITPEKSMKHFVWTKTKLAGGGKLNVKLNQPYTKLGFYKDVAVLAIPTMDSLSTFHSNVSHVVVNKNDIVNYYTDACPVSGYENKRKDVIDFFLKNEQLIEKVLIHSRKSFTWTNTDNFKSKFSIYSSTNGIQYKKINSFEIIGLNKNAIVNIPSFRSKYIRLIVDDYDYADEWLPYILSEIEFLQNGENPLYHPFMDHLPKIALSRASNDSVFDVAAQLNALSFPTEGQVIDLSEKMKNGTLEWDAPKGNYTIIRFGYTATGATNAPATIEGEGLECDKMDSSALTFHFNMFPQKMIQSAGIHTGNTFKFLLIDSWECAYQTWTDHFGREFKKRRGYELTSFIPALCGELIGNNQITDAFLHDYRKTVAELIEDNYYKKFKSLCHDNKLEMHAEIIYGSSQYPPIDVMRANSLADMQMFEFWAGHNGATTILESLPRANIEFGFPQFASIAYNRTVVGAEAFTSMAHLSESPYELKPFGDKAYCSGINQFILHSYVHQPNDNALMTLDGFASAFNRANPYWNYTKDWLQYHARIQYMLQMGNRPANVMHFIGDQLPQTLNNETFYRLPFNYNQNLCNPDVLQSLSVKNNKIRMKHGIEYDIISIPNRTSISLASLKKLANLVSDGAVLYGPKPFNALDLMEFSNQNHEIKAIASKLWGKINGISITRNKVGKGEVIWGIPLFDALQSLSVKPDFYTNENDSAVFLFIKKQLPDADVFFVNHQLSKSNSRLCAFKTKYQNAKISYPETGAIKQISLASYKDGYFYLPYEFRAIESALFYFYGDNAVEAFVDVPSDLLKSLQTNSAKEYSLMNIKASIDFFPVSKENIAPIKFENFPAPLLKSIPATQYFAGEMIYTIEFDVKDEIVNKTDVFLTFDKIACVGSVNLNDSVLGMPWYPNASYRIDSLLKKHNVLKIVVANEMRNRIIGDLISYGSVKNLKLVYNVNHFLNKEKPLKDLGIMGFVRIKQLNENN